MKPVKPLYINYPNKEKKFSCEVIEGDSKCSNQGDPIYGVINVNDPEGFYLCLYHKKCGYIYCQRCFLWHSYLKYCVDVNITTVRKEHKIDKLMNKLNEIEEMIKYNPAGTVYNEIQADFNKLKEKAVNMSE
jgi:hypothetical protein